MTVVDMMRVLGVNSEEEVNQILNTVVNGKSEVGLHAVDTHVDFTDVCEEVDKELDKSVNEALDFLSSTCEPLDTSCKKTSLTHIPEDISEDGDAMDRLLAKIDRGEHALSILTDKVMDNFLKDIIPIKVCEIRQNS